jgi:hypothetical protein
VVCYPQQIKKVMATLMQGGCAIPIAENQLAKTAYKKTPSCQITTLSKLERHGWIEVTHINK